jgi:DNA-3-methyladenine glycosylase
MTDGPELDGVALRRQILPASFYARPAELVAQSLLGTMLVHESPDGACAGRIVETEAYLACGDGGCHASVGMTPRNSVMWEAPGTVYVYVIHTHHMLNVVTGARGFPEAVLIRALEPVLGVELMQARRARERPRDLASGPGKLTQALGVTREHNKSLLDRPPLYVARGPEGRKGPVTATTRIGLREGRGHDLMLRYIYEDSECISAKPKGSAG